MSSPDDDRVSTVARQLNEAFFEASPAEHFRARAGMLADLGDQLALEQQEATGSGAFTADLLARLPGYQAGAQAGLGGRDEEKAALTVEAFMLAHHAGESLLRHFLAQYDSDTTRPPWLLMSARNRDFRARVSRLSDLPPEKLEPVVAWAFGGDRQQLEQGAGKAAVDAYLSHAASWLRHCASWHVQTSNGYNAAKHGLSSLPSHVRVSFFAEPGNADDEPPTTGPTEVPMLAGAVLTTLEHEGTGNAQRWYEVTRAVDPAGLVAVVLVLAELLDDVWQVGRARHLGVPAELALVSGPNLQTIMAGHHLEWSTFKRPIAALPLPPEEAQATLAKLLGEPLDGSNKGPNASV